MTASRLDTGALTAWLDQQGFGAGADLECRLLSGGAQNEIYEIRWGDLHAALRIPPGTAPATRDEGIVREWRIISALAGTAVPHPAAIALCQDMGVLGRAFYLMRFVDGWSPMGLVDRKWPAPFDDDLAARRGLAFQLVDGVVEMGKVDWQGAGLGDLGRPDGFHQRQVDRWSGFLERVRGRELPGEHEAAGWLRERAPLDFVPGLMHGDYQFANVMYAPGSPARLAAIVDWEMGTIGDPKLDLAWALHSWPADSGTPQDGSYVDMLGMPGRQELLDHYARSSGRQVDDIDYYLVLAKWKFAIVLEQGYQAFPPGAKRDAFGPLVLKSMREAAEVAGHSDYRGR